MIKKLIIGFVLFLTVSFQLHASEDRAMFWRLDSGEATVYLFGSIHFADESFYPLRKEIEQAFDKSDYLVVEIDMHAKGEIQRVQKLIQTHGYYTNGDTLKNNLSEKTYHQLQHYLKDLGVPVSLVEKQKPGIVVLTLAALEAQQSGLAPDLGIDSHFLDKAAKHKKILALETMEEQLKIFLDIEDADALLQDSFRSMDMLEEEMESLVEIWKQGNENEMYRLLFEDMANKNAAMLALYDSLFFKRNTKMAKVIKTYLKEKGQYFVVVGAGHLVGDKGIVNILKNAGYKLKRL